MIDRRVEVETLRLAPNIPLKVVLFVEVEAAPRNKIVLQSQLRASSAGFQECHVPCLHYSLRGGFVDLEIGAVAAISDAAPFPGVRIQRPLLRLDIGAISGPDDPKVFEVRIRVVKDLVRCDVLQSHV